jgi:uncharacterized protein (TIGR00730 family)
LAPEQTPEYYPKAYDNTRFLHSSQARTIRILAEYLEPQARVRQEKIRGTVVFFGSARALSTTDSELRIQLAREQAEKSPSEETQQALRNAEVSHRISRFYDDAVRLSFLLTKYFQSVPDVRDRHVICSGGGPGLMEAANRGAREAGGKTIGLTISLPHEQANNPYLIPQHAFHFHYFFMRKYWFVYLAQALVIFPGGFGTMDEFFEVLTLVQTQKVKRKLPIVLYGSEYWNEVLNFEAMVKWGVVSPEDLNLIQRFDTPETAFEYLKGQVDLH